tara:strand:- start:41 stop:1066 length:1026 start_codon:yes stop_codon:yes gene_type:complete
MASIIKIKGKKGTAYRAQIRRTGHKQTKTFDTKQAAQDWASDFERDIRDRRVDPKSLAERKTVRLAVEKYLSKIDHKSSKDTIARCSFYADRLGSVPLSQLNAIMIDEATDTLPCSGPTQNRYLGALSGCLSFIGKSPYGWIDSNPCKLVPRRKEHRPRQRVLSRDEWQCLIDYVETEAKKHDSERWKQLPLYLRLAYATGRRRSELLNLEWRAVDLNEGILHLLDTKTGDDQEAWVDKDMVKRLKAHQHDGHYVFRGRFDDKPTDFDDLIRESLRENFPPDFRGEVPVLHSIRHTVATELGDGGATETEIMAVTGHKSSASINRYVKKTVEAARAAQAKR